MTMPTADRAAPRLRVLVFTLASMLAAPMVQAAEDAQWLREVKAANELSYECFGEKTDADCATMVAHYEKAMAAQDADAGVRHEVFKYWMNAVYARGNNLLEDGNPAAALRILRDGHAQVMEHYDDGAHNHAIIDNLRLQGSYLAALVASGDLATAASVVALPREMANAFYEQREQYLDNERVTQLIAEGMVRSEEMETRYADALLARAGTASAQTHALAIEAYRNAITWLQRANEAGYQMPFEGTNPIRFAHLNNSLGKALLATGDREGAVEAHSLAFAAADCKSLQDGTMHDYDQITAVRPCNAAVSGYMSASGETQRLASEMAEAMYRQQMELYNTDISDLLRRAPAGGD